MLCVSMRAALIQTTENSTSPEQRHPRIFKASPSPPHYHHRIDSLEQDLISYKSRRFLTAWISSPEETKKYPETPRIPHESQKIPQEITRILPPPRSFPQEFQEVQQNVETSKPPISTGDWDHRPSLKLPRWCNINNNNGVNNDTITLKT